MFALWPMRSDVICLITDALSTSSRSRISVPDGSEIGPNESGATAPMTSSNHPIAWLMSGTVTPTWSVPTRPSCPAPSPASARAGARRYGAAEPASASFAPRERNSRLRIVDSCDMLASRVVGPRLAPFTAATGCLRGDALDDPERFDEREERLRKWRSLGPRADVLPVDLLAQRARPLEDAAEVRLLLRYRHQLRHHHVLECRHADAERHDLADRSAVDDLVGDRAARRVEDQVDEGAVSVPCLVEPTLGRPLRLPARVLERFECVIGVLRPEEEVDVVLALRSPSGPGGQAAAQHERDLRLLEDRGRGLHRLDQLLER